MPSLTRTVAESDASRRILTPEAESFLSELSAKFDPRRRQLLEARAERDQRLRQGELPDFLPGTREVREAIWRVAPIPPPLMDRRVEITGPADRKMIVNALNSKARVFMADLEDSNSPTWANCVEGQVNLADAVRREIDFEAPNGKAYKLDAQTAVLFVRPRGWHMEEKHILVDEQPISASLFDFGLFFFHNAAEQLRRGVGPYFYLPKLESHLEARLWNDVFVFAQERLGLPSGSVRATVLIETILAAFEMDEILFELRDHSAGLNCGRWDYIFSYLKKLGHRPDKLLPDRALVTMDKAFLKAYVEQLIETCHRRGIHAMGGMAAQIPIKNDPAANDAAMEKVRTDKLREVLAGHDGTWVAHPGLVEIAMRVFDEHMPGPNQIDGDRGRGRGATPAEMLAPHKGEITAAGLRRNVDVSLQYIESWLNGNGCVPIYNLMEDAATAEISRSQVWQWVHLGATLEDGRRVDLPLVEDTVESELDRLPGTPAKRDAARLFLASCSQTPMPAFLTTGAYQLLD